MTADARHPIRLPGAVLREVTYPAALRQPRHHHERTSVTLVFGGSLEEDVGSVHEDATPLSVVFKPAGTEHSTRIGPAGATTFQIELEDGAPRGSSERDPPDAWGWTHGGRDARRFLEIVRASRGGAPDDDLEDGLLELLDAVRFGPEPPIAGPPPAWLARVAEELEDTFASPRRVRELARAACVHPVALARAHRRHFGCSITERLRARRVREAAALLRSRTPSISSVAFRRGFSDQSHLTRVFRSETGLTPGAYRSLLGR